MTYVNELRETRPYLWAWQPRRLTLDALTGQKGTIVRAASASAPWDSWGASLSVVRDRPCWTFPGAGPVLGLQTTTNTLLHWGDWNLPPGVPLSGLLDFNERGPTNDGGLFYLGPDSATGTPRLVVFYHSANRYQISLTDGTSTVSSAIGITPTLGQRIRLRWQVRLDGGQLYARLWQSTNGGAEVAANESLGLAAFATFGTSPKLRLNSIGASNGSTVAYHGGVVARGNLSQAQLLEALNP